MVYRFRIEYLIIFSKSLFADLHFIKFEKNQRVPHWILFRKCSEIRYRKVVFFGVITIKCDVFSSVKWNLKPLKKMIKLYGPVVGGERGGILGELTANL